MGERGEGESWAPPETKVWLRHLFGVAVVSVLRPMRVLDASSRDSEDIEHSNVIPVLPVESRDMVHTGRTNRRRRREAKVEDKRSRGQRSLNRDRRDVIATDKQNADSAATILVSHYVTGQRVIYISFTYDLRRGHHSVAEKYY